MCIQTYLVLLYLRGIFVVGTYMAIPCEVNIAVSCFLAHICKNGGSIFLNSIMVVWLIFAMWHLYLSSDIKYVYRDMGVEI